MKTKQEIDQFIDVALEAWSAGSFAAMTTPDSGTCNMDFVVLKMRHGSKKAMEILERVGLRAYMHKRGVLHVNSPFGGQAMRRTAAVEAIAKVFRDAALPETEAYVYCLTD